VYAVILWFNIMIASSLQIGDEMTQALTQTRQQAEGKLRGMLDQVENQVNGDKGHATAFNGLGRHRAGPVEKQQGFAEAHARANQLNDLFRAGGCQHAQFDLATFRLAEAAKLG